MNLPRRRIAASVFAPILALSALQLGIGPAHAAPSKVLKVVGTTDVSDSGLIANVIEPDFEAAYPDYDFQYTPKGTGDAITTAETSGVQSALLVHAAALETQFVNQDYSLEGPGRSIFWGDYVLVGPKSDPAKVMVNGQPSHDVVTAFEKIAAVGAAGKADFVSRGSTPGTTVQEHALWALTTTVAKCVVDSSQGGGAAPVSTGDGTACSTTEAQRPYPSWYHATGLGQALNLSNGAECNYPNASKGTDCYVFIDRGTYAYQQSLGRAAGMTIVARDNDGSARGDERALVNSFHAYAIDPAKFTNPQIDTEGATKFLDFLTSDTEQKKIGNYLGTGRAAGFIPSAAPGVSVSALPTYVSPGSALHITGSIANQTPGTPALANVPVELLASVGGATPSVVDTDTTNTTGGFTFDVTHSAKTEYSVRVPDDITQTVDSGLGFKDVLQSTTQSIGTVDVVAPTPPATPPSTTAPTPLVPAAAQLKKHSLTGHKLKVKVNLVPGAQGAAPQLVLYRARPGEQLSAVTARPLAAGTTTFKGKFRFPKGKWVYQFVYSSPGTLTNAATPPHRLRIR